ncbi:MAG: hypothetical protein NTW19_05540 [Planctomycetota bacterium]|nr:hypothetical protein [Planctomycetota bacterium]
MTNPAEPLSSTPPSTPAATALPPPIPPRRRWLTVLLTAVIFVAGLMVGSAATVAIAVHRIQYAIHHPEEAPDRITRELKRKLRLNDEQAGRVRGILARHQQALQGIRFRVQPELEDLFARVESDVADTLEKTQEVRWHAMVRNIRERWLPPSAPAPLSEAVPNPNPR